MNYKVAPAGIYGSPDPVKHGDAAEPRKHRFPVGGLDNHVKSWTPQPASPTSAP
jgi:hypothetical protein